MTLLHVILASVMLTQVHASIPPVETIDPNEAAYFDTLAEKCGGDLLCYYSNAEIQAAMGMSPAEALAAGLLNESAEDHFADEELVETASLAGGVTDFTARRRTHSRRYRRGGRSSGAGERHALVGLSRSGGAVWGPFMAALHSCAPGCVPKDYNVYRRSPGSCHAVGRAIDVGAIVCGGSTHYAIDNGAFASLVSCTRGRGLKVLYREAGRGGGLTAAHYNHGHFSIGCGHGHW